MNTLIEEEISRRENINNNVINALNESFFVANYVDLNAHRFLVLDAKDYARKMMENCVTIEEGFETFIQTLVRPEHREKMRKFCESDTIAKRVKGKKKIECEYLSTVAAGWCVASFFPCEWDEDGEVTHVLFAVSSLDADVAREIELGIASKHDLEMIFKEVPGGIVLYRWDGEALKVLRMSEYYRELYGDSMINDTDSPDFVRLHPEDVADYQKAIHKALTETHQLQYVFRVWAEPMQSYVWTQIDAISRLQPDGTSLVYAIYTDVSEQKNAEIALAKKQASLETALSASNQVCCEYDPQLHVAHCFTETNFFNLPERLVNFPESLRGLEFVYPEDIDLIIDTVHSVDDCTHSAHCDVRLLRDGQYRWYECRFEPYFDVEKGRNVIILNIIDASVRIASIQSYKDRLHALEKSNEGALCMCDINLTKNEFANVQAHAIVKDCADKSKTFNEFLAYTARGVFDAEEQQTYREIFSAENLLKRFEAGENHIKFEHFYRIDSKTTAMVATVVDLIKEPISGDVVGICYAKDLNSSKLSSHLLRAVLSRDIPMAALIYTDTEEYYLYEVDANEYCVHKLNYWNEVYERFAMSTTGEELAKLRETLTGAKVTAYLEDHEAFSYAFYGTYRGKKCRLEVKFRYIDKKHNLILGTLRNITDVALYEQYKYDSEHDLLTGLYNRNTVFKKCRELLNAYPNEQFVMLHIDVRHFHLYNTFFGEEGGNRLLCRIADVLKAIGSEYDIFANARIEADVFCVFFPISRGLFEGHIRRSFEELEVFSPDFPLDLAIGAYWVDDPSMPIESMFARATIAAKSHKKNLYDLITRYDDQLDYELNATQQITSEMTTAIEKEHFKVYLQPKYALRSNKIVGAEALVRWMHPQRGIISPGAFIPVFEKNGFIANLDRYMWEHVCQILRRWKDEGRTMFPISVNISRVSMYSHLTVPFLKSLIEKYNIEPKYLELELTETAYMDDPQDLKRMLKELQEYGFKILMDDFGSGYSSLNTLRDLPVDVLKLDMKFLSRSSNDERARAVLSSVVRMSKLLNLPIVAEGVEEEDQAEYLRSVGCEYVQGFLYARPIPTEEYEELLAKEASGEALSEEEIPGGILAGSENCYLPAAFLEYSEDRFVYLQANEHFISEFGLIEDLKPASKVFREHLDDANYAILLKTFENCAKTKTESVCEIIWQANDSGTRKYHGYVRYRGETSNYADLAVTFMNVTAATRFGF